MVGDLMHNRKKVKTRLMKVLKYNLYYFILAYYALFPEETSYILNKYISL